MKLETAEALVAHGRKCSSKEFVFQRRDDEHVYWCLKCRHEVIEPAKAKQKAA